jgi:hypothetical protein
MGLEFTQLPFGPVSLVFNAFKLVQGFPKLACLFNVPANEKKN